MMVMVVMGPGAALASLRSLNRLGRLTGLRALCSLSALRRLEITRLRGLAELVCQLGQELGLGTGGLTGGVLKGGRDLGRHSLELGRVLLGKLLHLTEELRRRRDGGGRCASHGGRNAALRARSPNRSHALNAAYRRIREIAVQSIYVHRFCSSFEPSMRDPRQDGGRSMDDARVSKGLRASGLVASTKHSVWPTRRRTGNVRGLARNPSPTQEAPSKRQRSSGRAL
jgi:hypothetical protein